MTQPPHYPTQPPYNRQTSPAGPGYPQPSGPTYPQNQPYPQQPPPKSGTKTSIIITTMAALLIALVITVVYLATTKNNPTANTTPSATPTPSAIPTPTQTTPTPTPGRGWTINGNQLTGPTMTAQLPQGWRIGKNNGTNNDGQIVDGRNWINYTTNLSITTDELCSKMTERYRRSPSDPIEIISGKTWSGKPIITYQLTTVQSKTVIYTFYCINTDSGNAALLETAAWAEYKDPVYNAAQTLMTTWQWKWQWK